jgi:uncharacterized protein YbjQ (UPF0145 family)
MAIARADARIRAMSDNPFSTPKGPRPGPGNIGDPMRIDESLVTTALELPGMRIVQNLGVVRGIVVRSRSVVGNFVGGLQTIFGGNITIYTSLCERARRDAFAQMIEHANDLGANGIIAMRYDANEIMNGVTEVLAYGTAVKVQQA